MRGRRKARRIRGKGKKRKRERKREEQRKEKEGRGGAYQRREINIISMEEKIMKEKN